MKKIKVISKEFKKCVKNFLEAETSLYEVPQTIKDGDLVSILREENNKKGKELKSKLFQIDKAIHYNRNNLEKVMDLEQEREVLQHLFTAIHVGEHH